MTRVQLRIDRLSLPAMDPDTRQALLQALQAELQARLAAVPAAAWQGRTATHVLASMPPMPPVLPMPHAAEPAGGAAMGRRLARAIARSLELSR